MRTTHREAQTDTAGLLRFVVQKVFQGSSNVSGMLLPAALLSVTLLLFDCVYQYPRV